MKFTHDLLLWYDQNARALPWRNTSDPYQIWLSEVILQQTQVVQGLAYYERFCERFPNVEALAEASLDQVMKLWEGLGYYSRCRNLHQAAKDIVARGAFPRDYAGIRELKGVGDYTAAAIASFAFGLPYPVLDGNVARFGSRYFGIREAMDHPSGKKQLLSLLQDAMPSDQAGLFNQALIEFGALHCKTKQALCDTCPFASSCQALSQGIVNLLPIKQHKTQVKPRYIDYYIISNSAGKILVRARLKADIWRGLYDFPSVESEQGRPVELTGATLIETLTHKLTHRHLYLRIWQVPIASVIPSEHLLQWERESQWRSLSAIRNLAFPKALQYTVDQLDVLTSFKNLSAPISNFERYNSRQQT